MISERLAVPFAEAKRWELRPARSNHVVQSAEIRKWGKLPAMITILFHISRSEFREVHSAYSGVANSVPGA